MNATELLASIESLPQRRRELIERAVAYMVKHDGDEFRAHTTFRNETEGVESILFE